MAAVPPAASDRGLYAGWLAGFLVIAAILATGAVLWFRYHP